MKASAFCGCALHSLPNTSTPFSVVFPLDYYDGPVSGVLKCNNTQEFYRYELLDWDERHVVRIYALSLLQTGDVEVLLRMSNIISSQNQCLTQLELNYDRARQILSRQIRVKFIIAWDLDSSKVLSIRELKSKDQYLVCPLFGEEPPAQKVDWFEFLSIGMRG